MATDPAAVRRAPPRWRARRAALVGLVVLLAAPLWVPAAGFVLIVGSWVLSHAVPWPGPGAPRGVDLPPGVKVVNTLRKPAGIDRAYAMELSAADAAALDALLARLVAGWQLAPADDANRPIDFISLPSARPPWWPASIDRLPERHVRNVGQDYWSAWVDRPRRRVYVTWGDW